jgi:hypothetical protein
MKATYLPTGLCKCLPDESRCGWTDESLTAHLREGMPNDYQFRAELLLRARDRARLCKEALEAFQHDAADPDDLATKRELKARTTELDEARADERFAESMLTRVEEAAAAAL